MRYVELIERDVLNRGNIILESSLSAKVKRDYEAYSSVYVHTEDFYRYQKENNMVKGYVGSHGFKYVWIDIDEKDLMVAFLSCKKVISKIHRESGLDYESFVIYFSGSKGFHVGIPAYVIGQEAFFSETTGTIVKIFVNKLVENIAAIDQKIYDTTRIFRLPNSLNAKKGMYKVLVNYEKVLSNTEADLNEILENAKNCINDKCKFIFDKRNTYLEKLFVACVEQSARAVDIMAEYSEKDNNLKSNNTLFRVPEEGDRNDVMFKQCIRLFNQKQLKTNEVNDIMRIIWHSSNIINQNNPIIETEFRNIVNSAYKYARMKKVNKEASQSIDMLMDKVLQDIKTSHYITTGFQDFDLSLGGGLRTGNSYGLIGMGGTMKSFLLQQWVKNACQFQNINAIYLNGEMDDIEFFNRACKQTFNIDFAEDIKNGKVSAEELDELQYKIKRLFSHRFGITSRVNMSIADLEDMINEREQAIGEKVSMLAIDSFGSLEIKDGNEIQSLIANSREVKELAKRKNIVIVSLCHTSGKPPGDLRNVSEYVRGGVKLTDNFDAYFSLSKIVDQNASTIVAANSREEDDKIYVNGEAYIRFLNKRGNGQTINKLLKLDTESLTLEENAGIPDL